MAKPEKAGGWKASLAAVLKAHNNAKVDGSVASHATRDKRADVLYAGFKLLRELGYKLDTVHSFRGKHIEVLAKAGGVSPTPRKFCEAFFRRFLAKTFPITTQNGKVLNINHGQLRAERGTNPLSQAS